MRVALFLLLLPLCARAEDGVKPRLVVNDLSAIGVEPAEAAALTDSIVTYLSNRALFEVLGTRDVQTLLGAERQKQLAGACGDDGEGCSADFSQLVNARFVLSGQLARVGTAYQLTLQLVDTATTRNAGRASKLAGSLSALRDLVPYAASEATGSPLPPPPSLVAPVTLTAAGGALLLASGVVALLAFSTEAQIQETLCPGGVQPDGRCYGKNLEPRSFYEQQNEALLIQKIIALSAAVAGAALVGVGLWLLPPEDARTRVSLQVIPTATGFAFVGGF